MIRYHKWIKNEWKSSRRPKKNFEGSSESRENYCSRPLQSHVSVCLLCSARHQTERQKLWRAALITSSLQRSRGGLFQYISPPWQRSVTKTVMKPSLNILKPPLECTQVELLLILKLLQIRYNKDKDTLDSKYWHVYKSVVLCTKIGRCELYEQISTFTTTVPIWRIGSNNTKLVEGWKYFA